MIVPVGEPADNPDTTPTVLNYNEYIVYDTSQVKQTKDKTKQNKSKQNKKGRNTYIYI